MYLFPTHSPLSSNPLQILRILKNEVDCLNHGWFAVKNRSAKDIKNGVTIEERHINEDRFFKVHPWTDLKRDRVGIKPLKIFLGKLLYEHIRDEFPALVEEISQRLAESKRDLKKLGPARQTVSEQRVYLTKIVNKYQAAVEKALAGTYEADLQPQDPKKLRMHIHNANDDFASTLKKDGFAKPFMNADDTVDQAYQRTTPDGAPAPDPIYTWIRNWYRESRGAGLPGTINPAVVQSLFRQQCVSWSKISQSHLKNVEKIVKSFNQALFRATINDDKMYPRIVAKVEPMIETAVTAAEKQLETILEDEMGGILQTVNDQFSVKLQATRLDRIAARMTKAGIRDNYNNGTVRQIATNAHLSIEDHAVYEIHDILRSYYQVAMQRFADNVVIQVVERHLLGPDGPVKCFSSEQVSGLSDTELASLASDDYQTSIARTEVKYRIQRLEKAVEIAKKANM